MHAWRLVHNDFADLGAVVAAALVPLQKDAETIAPHVTILPPWGPKDLSWLLRRTSTEAKAAILGTHGWRLSESRHPEFCTLGNDPVSASAGQSVAQLLDGFAAGGVVDPLTASAFAGAPAAFLLGDEAAFKQRAGLLEQRCNDDPFEAMLTAITFGVKATQMWESATGETAELLAESWIASESTVRYVAQLVLPALHGTEPEQSIPGHPDDQRKVTMHLGTVTAMTLKFDRRPRSLPLGGRPARPPDQHPARAGG
jgi:hypothetical protein